MVNEKLCTGHGICQSICPEVFHVEDGTAKVTLSTVPKKAENRCRQAMEECPTNAITIEEE